MSMVRIIKKFNIILTQRQKIHVIKLIFLMVVGGFLEMISVSLILPFVGTIINGADIMGNKYVMLTCRVFNIESYYGFLVLLAMVMSGIYIFKNIFLVFQMMMHNKFANETKVYTQMKIFRNYLLKSYEYFLDVKSGDILQAINSDTAVTFSLLSQVLSLLSELIVSGILVGTIFIISPAITVSVATILIVALRFISRIIKPVMERFGKQSVEANIAFYQCITQAIQGIKAVKITRAENYFENVFEKYGSIIARLGYISGVITVAPRFMIEAVSMSSFFGVIAILIYIGNIEIEKLIPMLSGVAVAAVRLLPSASRISAGYAQVIYSEPSLDRMIIRLNQLDDEKINMNQDAFLEPKGFINDLKSEICIDNLDYKYPTGKKYILKGANLKIIFGQSVGIVGISGGGKTTLVDILLGLLHPEKGCVKVDGVPIQQDIGGWLAQIGYIPQQIFMIDGNIRENVAFGVPKSEIDDDKVWEALKEAAIADFVYNLPDGLSTEIGERGIRLSGGQRQRIGIARALYFDPKVLFFDEATSALDNETEAAIMDSISKLKGDKTMIIVAHRLTTLEGCDHIYKVEEGRITQER